MSGFTPRDCNAFLHCYWRQMLANRFAKQLGEHAFELETFVLIVTAMLPWRMRWSYKHSYS